MPSFTAAEIASLLNAEVEGDATRSISGAAALSQASETDLSFAAGKAALTTAASSRAGCLIVPEDFALTGKWCVIRVAEPRASFARALLALYPSKPMKNGIHPTAVVAEDAHVAPDCCIGVHVTVGSGSIVRSGCVIGNGCVIGDQVVIGEHTVLHANVTIYDQVQIGPHCVIHSGAVLGADGFGFALVQGRYQKFRQVGTVVIESHVEIGACCCIDRAALGITRIGAGTKLDNLVHVAHNCDVGENVVVAAQTGFSGSVTVGDYAVIGGQAGIGEKANIEANAVIGGKAGILTSATVHAGEPVWGIPARPLRKHLRGLASVNKLPELREEVRHLKQQIAELERSLTDKR